MPERSNIDGHWDEFADWCRDEGINIDHSDDWRIWWMCWNAALDACEAAELLDRFDGAS